jgi:ammonium transporter, Amt family
MKKSDTPNNIVLFLTGAATLWFGWFGFNAGSALSSNGLTALTFANTQIAAAAGGLGSLLIEWKIRKRPTLVGAASCAIAGLVGITPAAGYVTVISAIIIGLFTAPVCYFGIHFIKTRFKYDDTLDEFGVHGLGGIWGALATGLFATKSLINAVNNGFFMVIRNSFFTNL